MAQHSANRPRARSRKTAKKVTDATIGTHVDRASVAARGASQSRQATYKAARYGARASQSQVDTFMPTATSGEDQAAYRRRSQQRRYVESLQRRARLKRIGVFLVAALVVVAVAIGAGTLAFRGSIGSQMALRNSDAASALSAAKADEPSYTLVAVELGAVAEPLEQAGPDMIVLAKEDRAGGKLALMNIPAALKVTVDNDTRRLGDMALAGDASLISAVESYAKIDVNHYIKVEESGIAGIVDALGGLDVTFNQIIDDPKAGDVYYPLGTYTLNGPGALTYLRASNLKMGKTDQAQNQADFLKLLLMRLVSSERGFAADVEAIDEFFQTDLSLGDFEDFARWVGEIGEANVTSTVVPGYFTVSSDIVGDNGELFVSKAADFETVAGGASSDGEQSEQAPTVAADPKSFTVEIVNGTDIVGAAKTTAEALDAQGFRIADVGNAEQQVYDETLVIYKTRNTPAKATEPAEPVYDEEGNIIEGGDAQQTDAAQLAGDLGTEDDGAQASEKSQKAAQKAQEEADATERKLGEERAAAVIEALGMGRTVEGDMYYSFNADVLLIIGYDYKPVS